MLLAFVDFVLSVWIHHAQDADNNRTVEITDNGRIQYNGW